MDDLERLIAIEDIKKLKARYCRYVDTKQDEKFEALFTEDVEWTLMNDAGTGVLRKIRGRAEHHAWRASVRDGRLAGFTVHQCHTPEIEIVDHTRATGIWALMDYVRRPNDAMNFVGYGHYHEEYRRQEDGRWLISKVTVTRLHVDQLGRSGPVPSGAVAVADQEAPKS